MFACFWPFWSLLQSLPRFSPHSRRGYLSDSRGARIIILGRDGRGYRLHRLDRATVRGATPSKPGQKNLPPRWPSYFRRSLLIRHTSQSADSRMTSDCRVTFTPKVRFGSTAEAHP